MIESGATPFLFTIDIQWGKMSRALAPRLGGTAQPWGSLGGEAATAPLVARRPSSGLLSAVVADVEGMLFLKPQVAFSNGTVGWGSWAALGGPVRSFAC